MTLVLSILLVIALIVVTVLWFKVSELRLQLKSLISKSVNVQTIVSDLDQFRKVAKGYEVAGIKKAIKIVTDHGIVK